MQKIKDILNWYFNPSDFKFTEEHLFSSATKNQVNNSVRKMKELAIRLPEGNKLPEKKLIDDIYTLFYSNYNQEYSVFSSRFSQRDVRVLVWALDYKPNDNSQIILFSGQFEIAKRIITDKWKDSFIISLWHILLKNWNTLQEYEEAIDIITKLLHAKCIEYDGRRKDIINISSNIDLFLMQDSPKEYARKMLSSRKPVSAANSLISQKESVLSYGYYSKVIEKYVEMIDRTHIERDSILAIYQFLVKNNSKKSKLLVCSKLINDQKFNTVIEIIKSHTVNIIGDPVKKNIWKYSGLTENQETKIELARSRLNILLNKDFIDVFFEKLVQDERRKRYWLEFVDKINDIKFVGNRANYGYLKRNENISKFVDSRYKTTGRNQSTCALIIYSKDFVFVEFTDTGALYVYKNQNFNINLNAINAIADLKSLQDF